MSYMVSNVLVILSYLFHYLCVFLFVFFLKKVLFKRQFPVLKGNENHSLELEMFILLRHT